MFLCFVSLNLFLTMAKLCVLFGLLFVFSSVICNESGEIAPASNHAYGFFKIRNIHQIPKTMRIEVDRSMSETQLTVNCYIYLRVLKT